jgi:hypothetical protein
LFIFVIAGKKGRSAVFVFHNPAIRAVGAGA